MKVLIVSTLIFVAQAASASFSEKCGLRGEVTAVGKVMLPDSNSKHYSRPVKLQVVSVRPGPRNPVSCEDHVGKEMTLKLESVSLQDLAVLKKKSKIYVEHVYANALTRDGVKEFRQALLASPSNSIYNRVFNTPEVSDAMADLMEQIPASDLKVGQVQPLLSFCGFAGCENDFIVMLTIGNRMSNAQSATIVVQAHANAFGEMTAIKIISNPVKLFL